MFQLIFVNPIIYTKEIYNLRRKIAKKISVEMKFEECEKGEIKETERENQIGF